MCPDAELLSAYADGEVPSPWRERLAAHVGACPGCAARLSEFRRLGELLRAGDSGPGADSAEARVLARLSSRLEPRLAAAGGPAAPRRSPSARPGLAALLARSVSLPLPFAAAAALGLVFLTGFGLSALLRPSAAPMASAAAADIAPGSSQGASMEALIRYLEAQNAQVNLTIRLPSSATYSSAGSPLIVTAPPEAYAPHPFPVEEPASGAAHSAPLAETEAAPLAAPPAAPEAPTTSPETASGAGRPAKSEAP